MTKEAGQPARRGGASLADFLPFPYRTSEKKHHNLTSYLQNLSRAAVEISNKCITSSNEYKFIIIIGCNQHKLNEVTPASPSSPSLLGW
jgi:hypothetical protein